MVVNEDARENECGVSESNKQAEVGEALASLHTVEATLASWKKWLLVLDHKELEHDYIVDFVASNEPSILQTTIPIITIPTGVGLDYTSKSPFPSTLHSPLFLRIVTAKSLERR